MTYQESPYFAAIDLGSNSFHMLVVRMDDTKIEIVDREKEMVQLARGMQADGNLSHDARERALACLTRFSERLRDIPASHIRVVGTKTLRAARNALSFLQAAERALGVSIHIISGYEEARLVYTGFSHAIANDGAKRLVVDIGGGSTEFIIGRDYDPLKMESLPLGCVSFTERYFPENGKITEKAMKHAYMAACAELEDIRQVYLHESWDIAFGTSGTMKAVADLLSEEHGGAMITLESLEKLIKETIEHNGIKSSNIPKLRREVLPAGLAIIHAIFHQLNITTLHVSDASLKEGLIYDTLGRMGDHDARVSMVEKLMQQYRVDVEQAKRVSQTALDFWYQLSSNAAPLPGVSRSKILLWAALLHEVGLSISHSSYHHHGYYILRHSDLAGFGRYEQYILANLVKLHRKKLSKSIDGLDDNALDAFMPLVISLRLSARLHRRRETLDHYPKLTQLSKQGKELCLTFKAHWLEEHPLTHAGLEQEVGYLKHVGYRLVLAQE